MVLINKEAFDPKVYNSLSFWWLTFLPTSRIGLIEIEILLIGFIDHR